MIDTFDLMTFETEIQLLLKQSDYSAPEAMEAMLRGLMRRYAAWRRETNERARGYLTKMRESGQGGVAEAFEKLMALFEKQANETMACLEVAADGYGAKAQQQEG